LALSAGVALLCVYEKTQDDLVLEGSHLQSATSIRVTADFNQIEKAFSDKNIRYRAFADLDDAGAVRAMAVGTAADLDLPIHAPLGELTPESTGALVGSGVKVSSSARGPIFNHEGREYPVVGYLGRSDKSLLSNDVVILDRALLTKHDSHLVLDGPHIAKRYLDLVGPDAVDIDSRSTSRRTNLDVISPILTSMSTIVLFFGAATISILVSRSTLVRNHALILIGRTPFQTWSLTLAEVLLPLLVAIAIGLVCCWSIVPAAIGHSVMLFLGLYTSAIAGFVLTVVATRKAKP